ncbi:hypothetical protein [Aestuariirhabdus sp. LZHN29]|uniref:hypothetical protein n=1 Tax=Aestuariirhabdus sp. LZHN29 TaxID=3417462 RepID=UPI003CFA9AEC
MAIFRCSKCAHLREVGSDYIGKAVKCPKCEQVNRVHDTLIFIKSLIHKHIELSRELKGIREVASDETYENKLFSDIDIHNTNALSEARNLEPILQWFEGRNIQAHINPGAADTTGFFDEISLLMGNQFSVLNVVSNQIKYVQNKGYDNVKIDLSKKTRQEIQQITSFCKALYDYSFVAKYFYDKKGGLVRLTLQKAAKVRDFFNGIWMEWFALIKLLELFSEHKIAPCCTRSLNISFSDGRSNELDLFVLTEKNIPICIECKTGEFRQDIDKYLSLRKQLKLDKSQFVLCVFGLSDEQALGMTSMYDLTFVSETSLASHIQTLL